MRGDASNIGLLARKPGRARPRPDSCPCLSCTCCAPGSRVRARRATPSGASALRKRPRSVLCRQGATARLARRGEAAHGAFHETAFVKSGACAISAARARHCVALRGAPADGNRVRPSSPWHFALVSHEFFRSFLPFFSARIYKHLYSSLGPYMNSCGTARWFRTKRRPFGRCDTGALSTAFAFTSGGACSHTMRTARVAPIARGSETHGAGHRRAELPQRGIARLDASPLDHGMVGDEPERVPCHATVFRSLPARFSRPGQCGGHGPFPAGRCPSRCWRLGCNRRILLQPRCLGEGSDYDRRGAVRARLRRVL